MTVTKKLKAKVKKMNNKDKVINQAQKIANSNKHKRNFILDSVYNNQDKLICVDCEKTSKQNYINKYSNMVVCKTCLTQIELPI
jgi:late competence protein required for DNA uptake (superfamily II DNA/RNA helicase)